MIFLANDTNSSYWQTEIDKPDCDKTSFTLQHGRYRFIRMPFVLCNVPGTFLQTIDAELSADKCHFAIALLIDTVIFSRSSTERIVHLSRIVTLFNNAGVTLKLMKWRFFIEKPLITSDTSLAKATWNKVTYDRQNKLQ